VKDLSQYCPECVWNRSTWDRDEVLETFIQKLPHSSGVAGPFGA